MPVAMLSRVWWTGAEIFDDLVDGDFDPGEVGLSDAQAGIASAACLMLVPQAMIEQQDLPDRLKAAWSQEFAVGSLSAAEGQLDDVSAGTGALSWAAVMRIYAGKSGAPYGRDAAMTAMLANVDEAAVRGWRAFGRLFGVLRQLANDRASATTEGDKDLANGTRTLLLALAVEEADAREAQALKALSIDAMGDPEARVVLRQRLGRSRIVADYNRRVGVIHRRLSGLLAALAQPSEYRDLIQWMVDVSALDSRAGEAA
ncbi:polyprenyl synthase [Streptomyces sp. NPDC051362]|uniref:polyprenyl synthase n=1 Tax=Streptomyces sp. NPDC051362 TaxID=3365651 RepID=UPI0037B9C51D